MLSSSGVWWWVEVALRIHITGMVVTESKGAGGRNQWRMMILKYDVPIQEIYITCISNNKLILSSRG